MILLTIALCIFAPCFVSARIGPGQKRLDGEVLEYNYDIPHDMTEAMRFYPRALLEDNRYAHVFSTFCKKYYDRDYFDFSCVYVVRLTFNEFVVDTFKVQKFGIRPQAVNSILVVTSSDPVAEITKHAVVIRKPDGDCQIRIYVREPDRDGWETFQRSTAECNDEEHKHYYKEPPMGMDSF